MKTISCLWSSDVRNIQEDELLKTLVERYGKKAWCEIAKILSERFQDLKIGKQCRERWCNHLDPSLYSGEWLPSEKSKIFKLSKLHGKKWSKIAEFLPGRSENSIKNYFYSTVRKNIRRINKRCIMERITGPVNDLMSDPIVSKLVFCSSEKSEKALEFYKNYLERNRKAYTPIAQSETHDYCNNPTVSNPEENYQKTHFGTFLEAFYHSAQSYVNSFAERQEAGH